MTQLAAPATVEPCPPARAAAVFTRPRVLVLFPLGFAAGLPYMLVTQTLSAWLAGAGVPLAGVGLFTAVSAPYSLKLLWAPLVDLFPPPFAGRRRGWIILFQLALAAALVALGATSPRAAPVAFAALAVGRHRVRRHRRHRHRRLPHRSARAPTSAPPAPPSTSSATAPPCSSPAGWRSSPPTTSPSAASTSSPPRCSSSVSSPRWSRPSRPQSRRRRRFAPPSSSRSPTGWPARARSALLAFIALYRLADLVAAAMSTPFLLALGFSNTEIGLANKNVGIAATIAGALGGGALVARVGLRRPLVVFGLAVPLSNLLWSALAVTGKSHALLVATVAVHDALVGAAIAALEALLLGLCNRRYGARSTRCSPPPPASPAASPPRRRARSRRGSAGPPSSPSAPPPASSPSPLRPRRQFAP